jgi:hypothetical protein
MLSQVEPRPSPEGSGSSLRGGELEEEDEGVGEESAAAKQKRLKKVEKARKKAVRKAERKAEKAEKDAEKERKKAEKRVVKQKELDERMERLSGLFGWGEGPR